MRPFFLLCCGLVFSLLPACTPTFRSAPEGVAAGVIRAEDARFAAQAKGDTAAIGQLLTPELTYTHSNALVENRRQFVEDIATGRLVYHRLEPLERTVRVSGPTALVTGRVRVNVTLEGKGPLDLVLRYTEVYVRRHGQWKLLAWHSSREPA